jgi:hypothetical protein
MTEEQATETRRREARVTEPQEDCADVLEKELDRYPLRDASEDPRWAVRTVLTWICIAVFLMLFFLYLLIAGIWYD